MKFTSKSLLLGGKTLTFETGKWAQQATAAIRAQLGDTVVLATVVVGREREDLGYFPLSVEFVERLYAGGKIKGSRWVKREGRPSDEAVLSGRLIDRSIRPLFPKEFKKEVQVVVTVLSVDGENEPDIVGLNAVSAALTLAPVPWKGPVGAIRMGFVKEAGSTTGEYLVNPGGAELALSELDLVVSQTEEKTLMIEAGGLQVPEDVMLTAVEKAHLETAKLLEFIAEFAKEAGAEKKPVVEKDPAFVALCDRIKEKYTAEIQKHIVNQAAKEGGSSTDKDSLIEVIFAEEAEKNPENPIDKKTIAKAYEYVFFKVIRSNVIEDDKRADGRKLDELRPLAAEVSVLPRTHGSAVFQRGQTQVLTVATLGSSRMEQLIESAEGEEKKRYIHHYSFPPYSVGEAGRVGFLSRREIGHGALAERALEAVIPSSEVFPYTMRLVSETLSSNGSTSMASVCGSTLALMDAGVPILKPVAGISIGKMSYVDESGKVLKYKLLTDIIGLEDFSGDMDFKVAGTTDGITAIQLDVKDGGLPVEQIKEVFARAKEARLKILDVLLKALPAPRSTVSTYAPKVAQVKIPVEKIGELIGPGGRMIKNIIATTGADVEVDDDGTVSISGVNEEQVKAAYEWVSGLTREVHAGEIFENAEVKRILPFGAFVEFLPGKEGMVHVSKMADHFVQNPSEVVSIGDKVTVKVVEVDDQGRYNLTMKMNDEGTSEGGEPRERKEGHGRDFGRGGQGGQHHNVRPFTPHEGGAVAPKHPLAMQFEREKRQQRQGGYNRGPKRDYNR